MDASQMANRTRYGIVLAAVIVFVVVATGVTVAAGLPDPIIFGYLAVGLFVAGVEWDRIYLQDRTV